MALASGTSREPIPASGLAATCVSTPRLTAAARKANRPGAESLASATDSSTISSRAHALMAARMLPTSSAMSRSIRLGAASSFRPPRTRSMRPTTFWALALRRSCRGLLRYIWVYAEEGRTLRNDLSSRELCYSGGEIDSDGDPSIGRRLGMLVLATARTIVTSANALANPSCVGSSADILADIRAVRVLRPSTRSMLPLPGSTKGHLIRNLRFETSFNASKTT